MALEPVTNSEGKKGFYDASTGFIGVDDMQKVTNDKGQKGYYHAKAGFIPAPRQDAAPVQDNVPQWGQDNPNLYGLYGAGRALLRTGVEAGGTTLGAAGGALLPVPGTTLLGAGGGYAAGKRAADYMLNEPSDNSLKGIATDVGVGAAMQGAGGLISKIPVVKNALAPEALSAGSLRSEGGMLDKMAYAMMEKSLKVPPSIKPAIRENAINAALDNRIAVTKGGLKKAQGLLEDLGDQFDTVVANSANKNNVIKTDDVVGAVTELKDFLKKSIGGDKMAAELDNVVTGFQKQFGPEITVAQAQEIKQATNAVLKNKAYGSLQNVETETKKQLVRGLKDRIAAEIPEISGVNLSYSQLKALEPALERAVNRTGNWDWMSLSSAIVGGAAGAATGNVMKAAEAGVLVRMLKSPQVQSRLAIALKMAGGKGDVNMMANTIADTIYNKATGKYNAIPQPEGEVSPINLP